MTGGSIPKLIRAAMVTVVLLGLALPARAEVPRPAAAGTGEAVAWVHLRGGANVSFRAAGKQFPAQVGTALLRSDVLEVPAGEFVVVKLRNGYVVKIDEDTTLAVSGIVSLDAPPTSESLAAQLDRVLTREERGRAERIAATQARLAGADSVAPQSAAAPAAPPAAPRSPAIPSPPPPEPAKKSAARPPALSRGLGLAASDEEQERAPAPAASSPVAAPPFPSPGPSPGMGSVPGMSGGLPSGGLPSGGAAGAVVPSGAIKLGPLEVAAPLEPAAVKRVVTINQGQLRACYQRGLQNNPTLAGSLVLKLVLAADGSVATAEVASGKLVAPVERCAVSAAMRWRFPPVPAKRKGPATVTIPITFVPAS